MKKLLKKLWSILNDSSNQIQAIGILVLVIVTGYYAYSTQGMKETMASQSQIMADQSQIMAEQSQIMAEQTNISSHQVELMTQQIDIMAKEVDLLSTKVEIDQSFITIENVSLSYNNNTGYLLNIEAKNRGNVAGEIKQILWIGDDFDISKDWFLEDLILPKKSINLKVSSGYEKGVAMKEEIDKRAYYLGMTLEIQYSDVETINNHCSKVRFLYGVNEGKIFDITPKGCKVSFLY